MAAILLREADIEVSITCSLDDTLRMECSGVVDREILDGHILTSFKAERRDESSEKKQGILSLDSEVIHTLEIKRDALEALGIVADELVLLICQVRPDAESSLRKHQLCSISLATHFQRLTDCWHSVFLCLTLLKIVSKVYGLWSARCKNTSKKRHKDKSSDLIHIIMCKF